jgi:hypothetical protein
MNDISVEYGTTSDGLMAARVDGLAYIAIPLKDGFSIVSGWKLNRPIGEWSRSDVYCAEGAVADEVSFHAYMADIALHVRQRNALGRVDTILRVSTPWGMSQSATIYAEGIVFHSTAGHGGFKLNRARNAAMPSALRLSGGWYEEDAEWALVATGFPGLYTYREQAIADRTLRDWFPDAWEAVNGRELSAAESFTRDRQHFVRQHAEDWVVISAVRSSDHPGMVEAVATIGGNRTCRDARHFLVPVDQYSTGRHGFVVDPKIHDQVS